jgi:hypothetical protein
MKFKDKHAVKQTFKALTDVFTFGKKHKGETIESVISADPGYILWCHDEKVAKFTEEILQYADEAELDMRMEVGGDNDWSWGVDTYDFYADGH